MVSFVIIFVSLYLVKFEDIWNILLSIRNEGLISFNFPEEQLKLKVHV